MLSRSNGNINTPVQIFKSSNQFSLCNHLNSLSFVFLCNVFDDFCDERQLTNPTISKEKFGFDPADGSSVFV